MNVFRKGDPSDIWRARVLAEDIFGKGWEAKGVDVYKDGMQKAQIIGYGNCHVSQIYSCWG
jgi:alpha-mannosidase